MDIPTSRYAEYGAAIVRKENGKYGLSGNTFVTTGDSNKGVFMTVSDDFPNVVGSIHQHPPIEGQDPEVDKYPSDLDVSAAKDYLKSHPQINPSNFVMYIIDHIGGVRGFPYLTWNSIPSDKTSEGIAARRANEALPPALPPASGCE